MEQTLVEVEAIIDLMRDNGVVHYRSGDLELDIHPSAIRLEIEDANIEVGEERVKYQSDYDNPMLYPDGRDPVAEQREWLKAKAARK
jgi:hypothetical protein